MVRVKDITAVMERWAPRDLAWEKDNVGLQVGSPEARVRRVLVGLDPTESLVHEAARKRADLIITHHPLLFTPLRNLNTSTAQGRILAALIRSGRTLYSAHTNLDFAPGGTSFALGEVLGLRDMRFLAQQSRTYRKVVTFVPADAADAVAGAMAAAGGGTIGNYDACSFRTQGTGTFRGNARSSPRVGKRGRIEQVEEIRLEMLVDQRNLPAVLDAMRQTHPYEEVAYDVYPLENIHPGTGMGAIGVLRTPLSSAAFLRRVRTALHAGSLRYTHGRPARIRTVAVCGGAGRGLLQEAIASGADAFITADVHYHDYQDAAGHIVLIDAGHYETEIPVVNAIVRYLRNALAQSRMRADVLPATTRTSTMMSL
jgi:dinuclear metal center YbgI/SA1388 family protein